MPQTRASALHFLAGMQYGSSRRQFDVVGYEKNRFGELTRNTVLHLFMLFVSSHSVQAAPVHSFDNVSVILSTAF